MILLFSVLGMVGAPGGGGGRQTHVLGWNYDGGRPVANSKVWQALLCRNLAACMLFIRGPWPRSENFWERRLLFIRGLHKLLRAAPRNSSQQTTVEMGLCTTCISVPLLATSFLLLPRIRNTTKRFSLPANN